MITLTTLGLTLALTAHTHGSDQSTPPAAARVVKLTNIETSYPIGHPMGVASSIRRTAPAIQRST